MYTYPFILDLIYNSVLCYVGTYKKFDGSMHPDLDYNKMKELGSKQETKSSWWKSFTNRVSKIFASFSTSSGQANVKSFPVLEIFLSTYYDILTGRKPFRGSPITIMNDIIYIFNSLFNGCYHYDVSKQHHSYKNSNIKQVCMLELIIVRCGFCNSVDT